MMCVHRCPPSLQSHFSYLAVVPARFPPWPGRKIDSIQLVFPVQLLPQSGDFSPLSWVTRPMPSPPCPSPTAGPDSCWVFHVSTSCGSSHLSEIESRTSFWNSLGAPVFPVFLSHRVVGGHLALLHHELPHHRCLQPARFVFSTERRQCSFV